MDAIEVAFRRLHNQRLSGPKLADPVDVVRLLGGVQSQEFGPAKWGVGMRTETCRDAETQRLFDDGAILRTHVLRPTWHFLAAEELGWIQALTSPRVHVVNAYYYRMHGIDADFGARSTKLIAAALRGGNHLTRAELGAALAASGLEATGNRLAYIIMVAELDGVIASGRMRGKQHTYALVSERVAEPVRLTGDAALAELTRRFFTGHGPATIKDFAWWSSLTAAQIKRGLDLVGSELCSEQVDGLTVYFAPSLAPHREPSPTAYALQGYDEYGVAYTESRRVANLAGRVVAPPNANMTIQPLVLDSQVIGSWRRTVGKRGITIEPILAAKLTRAQRAACERSFARFGEFSGAPVDVRW